MQIARGQFDGIDWSYDRPEMIADGVIHALGLVSALVGTAVLAQLVVTSSQGIATAHVIYCVTLLVTLTASATYNLWPVSPAKWVLRRIDHAMIFGLIAGTYTPFLARIGSTETSATLAFVWCASVAGMTLKLLGLGQREGLATLLYLGIGWSGVLTIGSIFRSMPAASFTLLLIGGLLYSGGAVFHHWRSLRFQNAIWHGFVLAGATCHFAAVLLALRGP